MQVDISRLKMPAVSPQGLAVLEAVSGDDVNLMQVADLVAQDPALSSALLFLVNSPLYRRAKEITSARFAVNILGAKRVRMAVMMVAMRGIHADPSQLQVQEALWEHSFGIAALCRLLGQEAFPLLVDDLEMTGLLHDLGALVLAANFPDEYAAITADCTRDQTPIEEAEQRVFALDRGAVTQAMASQMHLPGVTRQALKLFHDAAPIEALGSDEQKHTAILALAHHIDAVALGYGGRAPMRVPGVLAELKALVGLRDEELDDLIEEYPALLNQAMAS